MTPLTRRLLRMIVRLTKDQRGGEVMEYAIVAGLIVVAAIASIQCVGTKVVNRWNTLNSSI